MSSDAFEASLPFILRWEGGYVNHPADPGGATNKGITQGTYDRWRADRGVERRSVKEISDAEVAQIYEGNYWKPPGCDLLKRKLDLVQFDTAVNMGTGRAIRLLQKSLDCGVDGKLGPQTRTAIGECDPASVLSRYCDAREEFYRSLVRNKPSLDVFLKGWMNRMKALRAEAGLLHLESPVRVDFGNTDYIAKVTDDMAEGVSF